MQTVWDYVTIAIFAGLIVVFLKRSMDEQTGNDPMWRYLPPALACALGNYLGNEGYGLLAVAVIVATLAYIVHIIKPFARFPKP